jgi:hypothetical protein
MFLISFCKAKTKLIFYHFVTQQRQRIRIFYLCQFFPIFFIAHTIAKSEIFPSSQKRSTMTI